MTSLTDRILARLSKGAATTDRIVKDLKLPPEERPRVAALIYNACRHGYARKVVWEHRRSTVFARTRKKKTPARRPTSFTWRPLIRERLERSPATAKEIADHIGATADQIYHLRTALSIMRKLCEVESSTAVVVDGRACLVWSIRP